MTCSRCAAQMVRESSIHYQGVSSLYDMSDAATIEPHCYHCLTCGNYIDAVILANRARQAVLQRTLERADAIATWALLDSVNTTGGLSHASTEMHAGDIRPIAH